MGKLYWSAFQPLQAHSTPSHDGHIFSKHAALTGQHIAVLEHIEASVLTVKAMPTSAAAKLDASATSKPFNRLLWPSQKLMQLLC